MSIFTSIRGFSFINENKSVLHVDISSLNRGEMVTFVDYLNRNNVSFNPTGETTIEISSGGTNDELINIISQSRVGDKLKIKPVTSGDYSAELIKSLDTTNYDNTEFQELLNKYRAEIDSKLATITSKIDNMDSQFDPYQLDEVRKGIIEQGKYINDFKHKLEIESQQRQDLSDYINNMNIQVRDLDNRSRTQLTEIQRLLDDRLNKMNIQIDNIAQQTDLTAIESDIRKLVTEFDAIKRVRNSNDSHVLELEKRIEELSTKMSRTSSEELIHDAKIANIAEDIETYNKTVQQSIAEITAMHMALVEQLEEIKTESPDDYKTMITGLDEISKTKIAVTNAANKQTEENATQDPSKVRKVDDEGKRDIDFGKQAHMDGNQYIHTIHLPIDKIVILNDLEKIKVSKSGKEKKFDPELDSTMAKISRGIHNLIGYDVENEAAITVAKYAHFRDATGSLARWIAAEPIGMLAGIAGGTVGALVGKGSEGFAAGKSSAENIGEFIKHEMTAKVSDLNPVIVKFEQWLSEKSRITTKNVPSKNATKTPIDKPIDKPIKDDELKEGMEPGGVTTPDGSSGFGNTPGTTFQTGLSISGAGNPVAPTTDTEGSGDDFNPKSKKRKKKKKEYKSRSNYVPFQVKDFATYFNQGKK